MPAKELSVYEKVEKHLFQPKSEALISLTPSEIDVKERLMLCVSSKMENPMMSDKEVVNFLMTGCGGTCTPISQSQAYRDVAALTKIVGNVQLSSKNWYRYMIIEGAKEGYRIALANNDAKGVAANLDKIGKYTRADKDDEGFDWDQMIPPSFEPTDDVTVIENMDPIQNLEEERKSFRALFKGIINNQATEAEIINDHGDE